MLVHAGRIHDIHKSFQKECLSLQTGQALHAPRVDRMFGTFALSALSSAGTDKAQEETHSNAEASALLDNVLLSSTDLPVSSTRPTVSSPLARIPQGQHCSSVCWHHTSVTGCHNTCYINVQLLSQHATQMQTSCHCPSQLHKPCVLSRLHDQ